MITVDELFAELEKKTYNLDPIMKKVCAFVQNAIQRNFDAKGRWNGTGTGILDGGTEKWKALAAVTKDRYKKKGITDLDPTLNRSTYGLYKSIQVYNEGTTVHVISNFPYANIHQYGGKAGKSKRADIPARPYVTLDKQDLNEIINFITDFLLK